MTAIPLPYLPPVSPPTIAWDVVLLIANVVVGAMAVKALSEKTKDKSDSKPDSATEDCPDEEPKKGKKVENSKEGEKVRTPDTHPDDFTKQRGGQGYTNNKTGEKWVRAPKGTGHRGEEWDVTPKNSTDRVGDVKPDGTISKKFN